MLQEIVVVYYKMLVLYLYEYIKEKTRQTNLCSPFQG
jgi:hypothetical protein